MQQQEFIDRVKSQAKLGSDDETTTLIRATLETLADHLAGNAPAKLAAQLPELIGKFITNYKSDETAEGEGFGVKEFLDRTTEKIGSGDAEIVKNHVIAVLSILREAVSEGEFDKMRGTLPPEYDELFGAGTFDHSNIGQRTA